MKNTTVRFIIILVSLLFINIEAAHAGLIHKLRVFIVHEFPDYQFAYISGGLLLAAFISYVLFAPVLIGKEKWSWLKYYTYQPNPHDFGNKRISVRRISRILTNTKAGEQVHS